MSDVNRIHGILRNDLEEKKMNVTAILFCSLNRGRRRYLDWIFPWYFGEKFKVEVDEKEEAI